MVVKMEMEAEEREIKSTRRVECGGETLQFSSKACCLQDNLIVKLQRRSQSFCVLMSMDSKLLERFGRYLTGHLEALWKYLDALR